MHFHATESLVPSGERREVPRHFDLRMHLVLHVTGWNPQNLHILRFRFTSDLKRTEHLHGTRAAKEHCHGPGAPTTAVASTAP